MVADGSVVCWGGGRHGQIGRGANCQKRVSNAVAGVVLDSVLPNELYHIACGASHTVCACRDTVYVWGNGADGQLGTGETSNKHEPYELRLPAEIRAVTGIACGPQCSIILTEEGLCYGFGSNKFSQLPISRNESAHVETQTEPALLAAVQHEVVVQVSCGNRHTVFLYECGAVATVGDNSYGQLGIGSRAACSVPQVLGDLEEVKLISCGANHTLAITESGELYVWGYGKAIGYKHKDIVRPTTRLSHYTNIVQLAAGSTHSLALTENGNVYSWGSGADGQLGHGEHQTFLSKPVSLWQSMSGCRVCHIAASDSLSAAITVDGKLYLWGKSQHIISSQGDSPVYKPLWIDLGPSRLVHIACGTWHVAGLTGTWPDESGRSSGDAASPDRLKVDERMYIDVPYMSDNTPESSRANSVCEDTPPTKARGDNHAHPFHSQVFRSREPSRRGMKTSIAEFYAPSPEHHTSGVTSPKERERSMDIHADSILLPGFKLPAILDATARVSDTPGSRSVCSLSKSAFGESSLRRKSAMTVRGSPRKSAMHVRAVSPRHEQSSEDEEEVENLLPLVTITRNQSRVQGGVERSHTSLTRSKRGSTSSNDNGVVTLNLADTSLVEQKNTTPANTGAWNPHRNSIFNSNVFYKDEKGSGVNPKMIGFLDMSDIQLVEKPTNKLHVMNKQEKISERHTHLYNKEMNLRNGRSQRHMTSNGSPPLKVSKEHNSQLLPAFQKATRRAQLNKQRPVLAATGRLNDHPQLQKLAGPLTKLDLIQGTGKLARHSARADNSQTEERNKKAAMKFNNLREHYHSAPLLLTKNSLIKGTLPAPLDFSKAMTKLSIVPGQGSKH